MEKKRKTKNIIAAVLLLAIAAGMVALPTLLRSRQAEPEDKASYLSASVERKDIRSTISGGGTLEQEKGVAVKVLKGVEIEQYLVKNGDRVEKGQPLAAVDLLSVQKTIVTIQDNLEHIAKQLQQNPEKTANDTVRVPAPCRVKEIYAAVGDKVVDVMAKHGCLAVVSLDGLMVLEIEAPRSVEQGRDVTVVLSGGEKYAGRVEVSQGTRLTVTLTDDGPKLGDTAEVFDENGESLGKGRLRVHNAWDVTGISGEVSAVNAKIEGTLTMNGLLFTLKDVDFSQENRRLSEQRREYEDAMQELFTLARTGAVTAPTAGRVSGIDASKAGNVRAEGEEFRIVLLAGESKTPSPERDKPSKYKNYSATVTGIYFSRISFLVEREPRNLKKYTETPTLRQGKARAVNVRNFSNVPIYSQSGKKWKLIEPDDLQVGDMLYFVRDKEDKLVMIVRPKQPTFDFGGGGGGGGEEENFEFYELSDTQLMEVTPQNQMTVQVSIDELDILSVAQGQTAEITLDALPGRAYYGTVSKIDPVGKNSGGSTRYTITIAIDRDENMLHGMNATAILTVGTTENVLTIPAAALCQRGSRSFVYTGFDSEKRELTDPVDVELGVSDGQTVEILSGLSEGDRIWYSYYETEALPILFNNQPVDEA